MLDAAWRGDGSILMYPVSTEHAARDIPGVRELPHAIAQAVRAALAKHDGDILALLPGMAEIRRTQALLENCGALVLPLHGDRRRPERDRAPRPGEDRQVVLATSTALGHYRSTPGRKIPAYNGQCHSPPTKL